MIEKQSFDLSAKKRKIHTMNNNNFNVVVILHRTTERNSDKSFKSCFGRKKMPYGI